jgi:hypothetical protein
LWSAKETAKHWIVIEGKGWSCHFLLASHLDMDDCRDILFCNLDESRA